ncbi:MAG: metal-dependent hydrolase [Thermodesulfobacteriota bacterium]
MTKTRITWLGHASIKIETKGKIIFLDPWLDENPVSTLKVKQVKKADAVCVTHGHIDHIGDSIAIVKATGAPLICTPEIGMYAEKFGGIKYDEGSIPLNIGGSWETADFTITMVNAVHTSDIMGEDYKKEGLLTAGSGSVGYVISIPEGPAVYYGGDTGVFADMAIIRDLYSPNIVVLPVGGKYNMGYREAGYATSLLHPEYFLPIHFGTFPNQQLNIEKLIEEIKFRTPRVKVVSWKPGDYFEYK